jgi:hypothetical protein
VYRVTCPFELYVIAIDALWLAGFVTVGNVIDVRFPAESRP